MRRVTTRFVRVTVELKDVRLFSSTSKFRVYMYYDNGSEKWKDAPPVTIEASMTEADFSGKHLGTSGAIMLAAFLPNCR